MRYVFTFLFLTFFLVSCSKNPDDIITETMQSVVVVISDKKEAETGFGMGTGFFIGDNVIITNYHVIEDSKDTEIYFGDKGIAYKSEFLYGDKMSDIAVLRLVEWDKFVQENPTHKKLTLAKSIPKQGSVIYVIGHPWGLFYSVSKGIISSKERKLMLYLPNWYIQTDASLYNGNSGGPVINKNGEVIGISTIMLVKEGGSYGFAVPSLLIKKVLNDLKKYDEVRWIILGITMGDLNNVIADVKENGAAHKAGIKAKDQIVSLVVNNKKIDVDSTTKFMIELSLLDYKDDLTLIVKRNDDILNIPVKGNFRTSDQFTLPKK